MAVFGKYIYGIISVSSADYDTLKNSGFEFVFHKDVAVLIGDSEISDFASLPKEIMARKLVFHQQTIEKIMELGYTIIPMKLGTFAIDKNEIEKSLMNNHTLIRNVIDKAAGAIEVDIVTLWSDFSSILKEAANEEDIINFKEKLMKDPSKITVENQKQIGMMIASSLTKKRDWYAKHISQTLSTVSIKSVRHDVMDDQMISNTAYLINKGNLTNFDSKVDELNTEFKDKLRFRYIGPLPCYSFYTFEMKRIEPDKIEWARNQLSLDKETSLRDIKKAYKKKALEVHPDKDNTPPENNRFNDLNSAYRMLIDFCTAAAATSGLCSLTEENINKNNLIVKLKD